MYNIIFFCTYYLLTRLVLVVYLVIVRIKLLFIVYFIHSCDVNNDPLEEWLYYLTWINELKRYLLSYLMLKLERSYLNVAYLMQYKYHRWNSVKRPFLVSTLSSD